MPVPLISDQFSTIAQLCPTLQLHGLKHPRLLSPSTTPGACSNSCLSSQWCHPTISPSAAAFSPLPLIFPSIRVFSNESVLWSEETDSLHGPQPCLIEWNCEPCCLGPPKMDESWWRVLTKCGPLDKGMANHFSTLALRTPWIVWKGKKIWHWMMNSPGYLYIMILEKRGKTDPEE